MLLHLSANKHVVELLSDRKNAQMKQQESGGNRRGRRRDLRIQKRRVGRKMSATKADTKLKVGTKRKSRRRLGVARQYAQKTGSRWAILMPMYVVCFITCEEKPSPP